MVDGKSDAIIAFPLLIHVHDVSVLQSAFVCQSYRCELTDQSKRQRQCQMRARPGTYQCKLTRSVLQMRLLFGSELVEARAPSRRSIVIEQILRSRLDIRDLQEAIRPCLRLVLCAHESPFLDSI